MARLSASHPFTRGKVLVKGIHFHFVTNGISVKPSRKNGLHNFIASLGVPGQAGIWTGDRQTHVEDLYKFRTKRRLHGDSTAPGLSPRALQGGPRAPRRLVDFVKAIPKISRVYFKSPFRRALYGGISLLGGFYVAQTISLSFGALGVNDVIAAVLCVLFAEYITKYYHTRPQMTFTVALINNFKMGFTYGLFIDAFKLAS